MQKHLYFICPTDGLETVLNSEFKQENYFYTSLGNSLEIDIYSLSQLIELVLTKEINQITFVLSDDNCIVLESLKNRCFSERTGFIGFHQQILKQKEDTEVLWKTRSNEFLILSYHLNDKIKELKQAFNSFVGTQCLIAGKIYSKNSNTFTDIYPDIICLEQFNLN